MANFLNEDWSDRPAGPRLYLGAFGKHPGWNDHFDVGLETDSMVAAKHMLYIQGIRAEVEAQTWEKLPESDRLPEFDHWFLWLRPKECLLGYFCSSKDGKGRAHYPLVLCAHLVDLPLSWAWSTVMPRLAEAAATLRAASTAGRVTSTLGETLDLLRGQIPSQTERHRAGFIALAGVDELSNLLRSDRLLLYPIYHEIAERFAGFAPGACSFKDDTRCPRGQSIRLPSLDRSVPNTINAWLGLLLSELDPGAPALAIMPTGGDWVDITLGLPGRGDLFRMRAGRRQIPIVTDLSRTPTPRLEPVVTQKFGEIESQNLPTSSIFNCEVPLRNVHNAVVRLGTSKARDKGLFSRLFGDHVQRAYPVFCGD